MYVYTYMVSQGCVTRFRSDCVIYKVGGRETTILIIILVV